MDMPSTEVPTVDTTSPSLIIQSEVRQTPAELPLYGQSLTPSKSSCLPPHHPVFPEWPHATDIHLGDVHGGSAPPSSAFASTITPLTDSPPLSTTPLSFSSNLPVSPLLIAPSDKIIYEYFDTNVPRGSTKRANRIRYLVQAAKGFWDASLRQSTPENVSTILSEIDTSFLYKIHIAHHVGLREKLVEKLGRGVGSLTPALEKTAQDLSLERPKVQIECKEGKRYVELILLPNGGPGSLLLLGRLVKRV
jgi:hypothetical protein